MAESYQDYLVEDELTGLVRLYYQNYLDHKELFDDIGRDFIIAWLTNEAICVDLTEIKRELLSYCNMVTILLNFDPEKYHHITLYDYSFMLPEIEACFTCLKDHYKECKDKDDIWKYTGITLDTIYNRVKSETLNIPLEELLSDEFFNNLKSKVNTVIE